MSISSDIGIKREKALKMVYRALLYDQKRLLYFAVNAMSNSDLGSYLHSDTCFYDVEGKGKLTMEEIEEMN